MASLIGALATTAKAVADTIKKKNNNTTSESTTINGTKVTGTGNDMTITSKSRTSKRPGTSLADYGVGTSSSGTSTDYGTYKQDLDRLTQAQRQAQVDQLKAARTKALANLDAQEQTIKPAYETARNQTSASSQQGARNLAEYLANRGLTNSGAAAQAETNRQSALINNLGNINTAEANAYRDIANQRTAIENDYVAGLANANNSLTNNYYNNLLNYNEQQRQQIQALQNQANYQYYDNIQARIDELLAQGYSPNSYEVLSLQALKGQKVYNTYNNAMSNAMNNVLAGNINYNNAAQLGMTVPQAYNAYNTSEAEKAAAREQAQRQAEFEAQQYNDKLAQQQFQNNLDMQKLANATAETQYKINEPYNTTVYHVSNNNGSDTKTPKINTGLIEKRLNSLGDDKQAQRDYLDYLYSLGDDSIIDGPTYTAYYAHYGLM